MTPGEQSFALAFRSQTLRTGAWPKMVVCVYVGVYLAMTPEQPNRALIAGLAIAALLTSILSLRLPVEAIIRARWCEAFFVSWSSTLIALISVAVWADGGVGSALESLFFLPVIFAALSYPLPSMLLVGAVDVGAYLAVAALSPGAAGAHVFAVASSLAAAAWICAWQSRNHDRHRRSLDHASRTDPLTGSLNRRAFAETFERMLARALRTSEPLTLVLVDLDDFKAVNDRHGHAAGDEVLRWVATRLSEESRAGDVVARLGGDEFAVLLPAAYSPQTVERISRALAERVPASVGAAVFPADGADLESLARTADRALYEHKRTRKGVRERRPHPAAHSAPQWGAAATSVHAGAGGGAG